MILRSGEPKVLDFGIARVDSGHLTSPGELFGTPLYMSPEQAQGQPVDARSDLFSLGTIAYALLTGESPFAGPSVPAILARVAHRSARPPSESVPGLPRDVDDVLARAMAKSPEDRYLTGQMIAEDIEDVLGGRPPRHRAAWTPTPKSERTIASVRAGDLAALDLVEEGTATTPRRPRRHPLTWVALLAVTAAAAFHFSVYPEDVTYWRRIGREADRLLSELTTLARIETPAMPSPQPEATGLPVEATAVGTPPTSEESGRADIATAGPPLGESSPSEHAASEPRTPEATAPESTVARSVPTPPPQPAAADRGTGAVPATTGPVPAAGAESPRAAAPSPPPKPARPSSKPAPRKPPPPAWLSIGFEHHLASGTLEVWVDGKRVAKEALDSRVTRKLLLLELRQGSVQQTLSLMPGRHEVRVRLRSADGDKTARTSATFRSGATRRLEVTAPRLRGGLTLEWK
jgi:hypothetical protein